MIFPDFLDNLVNINMYKIIQVVSTCLLFCSVQTTLSHNTGTVGGSSVSGGAQLHLPYVFTVIRVGDIREASRCLFLVYSMRQRGSVK